MLRSFDIDGHRVTPVHAPGDRLAALLDTIKGAQQSICLFSYMFTDDQTGGEVSQALQDASKRGVSVQVMVDDFGSGGTAERFFDSLKEAGVSFRRFSSRWSLSYVVRNHQKILIADKDRAVVGGFNIADTYFGLSDNHDWEDFGVVVEGDIVGQLYDYFQDLIDLDRGKGVSFRKLRQIIRSWRSNGGSLSWQIGGPTNRISPWARQLKHDLESGERLDLVMAYFCPTQSVLRRIAKITRKEKGGHLILAGKTDNGATIPAARSLYSYLIKRSARIFEFQPKPLHMKLVVVDDVSYVGSSNLDVRSLFINMEIMLRIDDRDFADHMRQMIGDMAGQSREQTTELHKQRTGIFRHIKWALAYLLVNSVDYTIGRRIKFRLLRNR